MLSIDISDFLTLQIFDSQKIGFSNKICYFFKYSGYILTKPHKLLFWKLKHIFNSTVLWEEGEYHRAVQNSVFMTSKAD